MAFPTTYLVGKGFISVTQLLTKQQNCLDICKRGDLQLMLTTIKPSITNLAKQHHAQNSFYCFFRSNVVIARANVTTVNANVTWFYQILLKYYLYFKC